MENIYLFHSFWGALNNTPTFYIQKTSIKSGNVQDFVTL